jgi:hypothetical protein
VTAFIIKIAYFKMKIVSFVAAVGAKILGRL